MGCAYLAKIFSPQRPLGVYRQLKVFMVDKYCVVLNFLTRRAAIPMKRYLLNFVGKFMNTNNIIGSSEL